MKALLILLLPVIYSLSVYGQCTVVGPNNASSSANDNSIGTLSWSNTSNAQISDNSYASAGQLVGILSTVNTRYLVLSNFGFSIPGTANICGVIVEIEKSAAGLGLGASIKDNSVMLVSGGSVVGMDKANASNWSGTDSYISYGSSSDGWGAGLTGTTVNSSSFGIAISAKLSTGLAALFLTAQVDHIRITLHYAIPVPIRLKKFSGKENQDGILLEWVTASESNSMQFVIRHSADGRHWMSLDSVKAAGNSVEDRSYSKLDSRPYPVNYYQLVEKDLDSREYFSQVLYLAWHGSSRVVSIFPNPVREMVNIESRETILRMQFFNQAGLQFSPPSLPALGLIGTFDLRSVPAGLYFICVSTNSGTHYYKVLVQH